MRVRIIKFGLSILCLLAAVSGARADIDAPVTSLSQLNSPEREAVVRLAVPKVLIADYGLIRRDFAQTRAMTEAQIDQWLVGKAGWVSSAQAKQTIVNTPIPTVPGRSFSRAYRPFLYNRALVFEVGPGRYIDAKGAGSRNPEQRSHGNGLATTYEALREFIVEKKVQQVLKDAGTPYRTVGSYAVIDYGFMVNHADGSQSPAGALLRQAHTRRSEKFIRGFGNSFLEREESVDVERVLRRYGFTSSAEGDWWKLPKWIQEPRDVINIQGNDRKEIFDFGTYRVRERFSKSTYYYTEMDLTAPIPLLDATHEGFVQPDPRLALPVKRWGRPEASGLGVKEDMVGVEVKGLVDGFRRGDLGASEIRRYFSERMSDGGFPVAKRHRSRLATECFERNLARSLGALQ